DVQAMIGHMVGVAMESQENPKEVYKVGLNTSRLLMAAGELIIAWLLLRQADIAQSKLANAGKDTDFYTGKIASAKFFVKSVLPHISVERTVVETETGEIMDIAEAAF
ncbi:MAG: acyl-CoA dehydrogenase, partial [Actinobacteria bacterium]|nr:acyl-CoA dehydrogenase [Actinomycetota bacterium]